jgi:hypothetical protein
MTECRFVSGGILVLLIGNQAERVRWNREDTICCLPSTKAMGEFKKVQLYS